jgi:hypothetical protein
VLRPPVAQDRLSLSSEGHVLLRLRHPWSDGTTHLSFDPVEFLERLAALVPRPRINLILYHGVLAPRAAWPTLVASSGSAAVSHEADAAGDALSVGPSARGDTRLWADLMRRSFGLDTLACPRCGGRFALIAVIEEATVVERILQHLRLPTDLPAARPSRAPPLLAVGAVDADPHDQDIVPCC